MINFMTPPLSWSLEKTKLVLILNFDKAPWVLIIFGTLRVGGFLFKVTLFFLTKICF